MQDFHIITDSAAHLTAAQIAAFQSAAEATAQMLPLSSIPYTIHIDGHSYREGIDITPENAADLINRAQSPPQLIPPSVEEYEGVFRYALSQARSVLSIHTSREMTDSWLHAKEAASRIGHKNLMILDSQTIGAAQGLLVSAALTAIQQNDSLDDVVREVRGAVERIYAVYFVESLEYLQHSRIMSRAHCRLGKMLGIKPFLAMENGRILPIEKVKTRAQGIERLVEFIVEFTDIEAGVILQPRTTITEATRQLRERLATEFPDHPFPFVGYNPSLATFIGTDALGVCVLEQAWLDDFDDLTGDD